MVLTGQTGDGASRAACLCVTPANPLGLSVTSRLRPHWRLVSAIVHLKLRSVSAFFPQSIVRPLELGWENKHHWRTAARCSCFPVLLVWAGRQEGFVSEPFIFSCSSAPSWRIPGWAGSLIHGTITSYPGDGKWVHQQSGHHSKSNKIWEGVCLCVAIHWWKTTWSCDRTVTQWGDLQLS